MLMMIKIAPRKKGFRIMGKTRRDRIKNVRIREELKQKSVDETLQERQLKCLDM